jgi:hypothetical protein
LDTTIKYLRCTTSAINFPDFADTGSTHLHFYKIKLIDARNATHSRVATSNRSLFISATTLSLPIFCLISFWFCAVCRLRSGFVPHAHAA